MRFLAKLLMLVPMAIYGFCGFIVVLVSWLFDDKAAAIEIKKTY